MSPNWHFQLNFEIKGIYLTSPTLHLHFFSLPTENPGSEKNQHIYLLKKVSEVFWHKKKKINHKIFNTTFWLEKQVYIVLDKTCLLQSVTF